MSFSIFSYVELGEANKYFSNKLKSENWDEASNDKRLKALIEATRLINNLNIRGQKYDVTQLSLFPRIIGCEYFPETPEPIKIACVEIAYSLLDETLDMELEIAALADSITEYSSVKLNKSHIIYNNYIRAGIPSALAWQHLLPFLNDPRNIEVNGAN